ncbi:MAG: MnmC family methyltransferase, partial [Candidatus Gastranaerophilaceae bacterium]
HSAYGALSEAFEKFIFPIKQLTSFNKDINVLDVCYGLGYNSKSFLNCYGKKHNIKFDCLDIDKNLFLLSPFIKTNSTFKDYLLSKLYSNYGKEFLSTTQKEKIVKYTKNIKNKKYKIDDWVNFILIENLYNSFGNELFDNQIMYKYKYKSYFNNSLLELAKFYQKNGYKVYHKENKLTNLHNIYYRNITKRYKSVLKTNIEFNFYINDARKTVQNLNTLYDVIMLDAFTTNKCPQLWSIDFFKHIYRLTADTGVLLTYSSSAIVRNTLLSVGYNVGKIIDKNNKAIGTIATKNNNINLYSFNEYELGLITKTKAGIPYKDKNLNLSAAEIIANRKNDVINSNLITSSKYIKQYKGAKNEI